MQFYAALHKRIKQLGAIVRGRRPERARAVHLEVARWGESEAERLLAAKGYRILARRLRVGRRDELDLVARDGDNLVFVEVKTRSSEDYGRPLAAVTRHKKLCLSRAAVRYLKRQHLRNVRFRFDVVEVMGAAGAATIRHLINVFPLDSRYRPP